MKIPNRLIDLIIPEKKFYFECEVYRIINNNSLYGVEVISNNPEKDRINNWIYNNITNYKAITQSDLTLRVLLRIAASKYFNELLPSENWYNFAKKFWNVRIEIERRAGDYMGLPF